MGVPARPRAAAAPGPAHPVPAASAAAPGPRVRHRGGVVAAVGTPGGVPQVRPDPPLLLVLGAGAAAAAAFGGAGPGALPAPAAGTAGGAPAADRAAADVQDRVPRARDPALSRAGDLDHHQGRRVRPDLRRPRQPSARCTCSTRRASGESPRRSAGPRSTAARSTRPRSAARTRSRRRCRRRASKTARSGRPRPATTCGPTSTPPRWPAWTCGPSPGGCWATTRTPPSRSSPRPGRSSGR